MASVLQPWVEKLSLMQQSVLISAVRGPDGFRKDHSIKNIVRWYRRCVLVVAFTREVYSDPYTPGGGNFTGPVDSKLLWPSDLIAVFTDNVDELPFHFTTHFLFAAEILGYKHPDLAIRHFWYSLYIRMCKKMNLKPEAPEDMDIRLGDNEKDWRKASGN